MLMKRIGKMRQKKGAVLFAVIAVMTLLIAMASTAYYTARSAYNSVISNYDYSQLYLSAISVSDMVVEAMASEPAKSAEGINANWFTPLREAVFGKSDSTSDGSAVTELGLTSVNAADGNKHKIAVKSAHISASNAGFGGGVRNDKAILEELANSDSVVPGVLDGVVIEIELISKDIVADKCDLQIEYNPDGTVKNYDSVGVYNYNYVFRTIAYYRNNYIIVEDVVSLEKTFVDKDNTDVSRLPKNPDPDPVSGKNDPNLNTFFTSTGQYLGDDENGNKEIKTENRKVIICTNEITDDAYFQNDHTFFVPNSENVFKGGISSLGSVYIGKMQTEMTDNDNDWFVGKDLVLYDTQGNKLNLNGNNLYVGGNLVLSGDGPSVTAEEIYVEGNLYVTSDVTINGNLHVKGQIIKVEDADDTLKNINQVLIANTKTDIIKDKESGTFTVTGEQKIGKEEYDGTSKAEGDTITITKREPSADGKTYENVTIKNEDGTDRQFSVTEAIAHKTGTIDAEGNKTTENKAFVKYNNYTGKSETYNKTVTVDFQEFKDNATAKFKTITVGDGSKSIVDYYEYTNADGVKFKVYTPPEDQKHVTSSTLDIGNDAYKVEVELPFEKDGYILDVKNNNLFTSTCKVLNYNIDTKGETIPIVLKDNTTTSDGKKAFSWKTNTEINALVTAEGNGNVVFEMANYNGDEIGAYNKDETDEVVVYKALNNDMVGTDAQVNHVLGDASQRDVSGLDRIANLQGADLKEKLDGMVDSNSIPTEEYQNQFMLVSNANNAVAYDAQALDNLFCGYVYAPNADFLNAQMWDGQIQSKGGTNPVFGGMIVSQYYSHESTLYYADPSPDRISKMMSTLYVPNSSDGLDKDDIIDGDDPEQTEEFFTTNADRIDNADSAILEGSNYVG